MVLYTFNTSSKNIKKILLQGEKKHGNVSNPSEIMLEFILKGLSAIRYLRYFQNCEGK